MEWNGVKWSTMKYNGADGDGMEQQQGKMEQQERTSAMNHLPALSIVHHIARFRDGLHALASFTDIPEAQICFTFIAQPVGDSPPLTATELSMPRGRLPPSL